MWIRILMALFLIAFGCFMWYQLFGKPKSTSQAQRRKRHQRKYRQPRIQQNTIDNSEAVLGHMALDEITTVSQSSNKETLRMDNTDETLPAHNADSSLSVNTQDEIADEVIEKVNKLNIEVNEELDEIVQSESITATADNTCESLISNETDYQQQGKGLQADQDSYHLAQGIAGKTADATENDYNDTNKININTLDDHSIEENNSNECNSIDDKKSSISTDDVIVLYLIAEQGEYYQGYDMLQSLLAAGFRHGDKKIFHRHQQKSGQGDVLFSLAQLVNPGHFDLSNIGACRTPGLTIFLQMSLVNEPLEVFELMYSTASQMVEDLGGEVYNKQRQVVTADGIAAIRQRIATWVKFNSAIHSSEHAEGIE